MVWFAFPTSLKRQAFIHLLSPSVTKYTVWLKKKRHSFAYCVGLTWSELWHFCASETVTEDTEKLEMYEGMHWDEGKQVITVMSSDSCLLKACVRFTEGFPNLKFLSLRHHNAASPCCSGPGLDVASILSFHYIWQALVYKKKEGLDLYHWLPLLFCSLITALWRLWQSFHQLWNHCHRIRVEVFSYNRMTSF